MSVMGPFHARFVIAMGMCGATAFGLAEAAGCSSSSSSAASVQRDEAGSQADAQQQPADPSHATVIVSNRGTGLGTAGQDCFFVDATGATTQAATDASGQAQGPLPHGGAIVVATPLGVYVVSAVQDGDVVRLATGYTNDGPPMPSSPCAATATGTLAPVTLPAGDGGTPPSRYAYDLGGCSPLLGSGIDADAAPPVYTLVTPAPVPAWVGDSCNVCPSPGVRAIFSAGSGGLPFRQALLTLPAAGDGDSGVGDGGDTADGGGGARLDVVDTDWEVPALGTETFAGALTWDAAFVAAHPPTFEWFVQFASSSQTFAGPSGKRFAHPATVTYALPPSGLDADLLLHTRASAQDGTSAATTWVGAHASRTALGASASEHLEQLLPRLARVDVTGAARSPHLSWSTDTPLSVPGIATFHAEIFPPSPDGGPKPVDLYVLFPLAAGTYQFDVPALPEPIVAALGLGAIADVAAAGVLHRQLSIVYSPQHSYADAKTRASSFLDSVYPMTGDVSPVYAIASRATGTADAWSTAVGNP